MGIMESLVAVLGRASMESLSDHIRLENVENSRTVVMKDGTLVSMIKLSGMFQIPGVDAIINASEDIRIGLASFLSKPGHSITLNFLRDPYASAKEIRKNTSITKRVAHRNNLDLDDVLDERQKVMSERLVFEETLICLYSRDILLDKEEKRLEKQIREKSKVKKVPMIDAQFHGQTYEALNIRHDSFVNSVLKLLNDTGQLADLLDVREMLIKIHGSIVPGDGMNTDKWSPNLPYWSGIEANGEDSFGSSVTMVPETDMQMAGLDFSNFGVMTLDRQLATEPVDIIDNRSVKIGDKYFMSFDLSVAPEVLVDFNTLVLQMTNTPRKVPWRSTFYIESGGVQAMSLKDRYLDVLAITSKMSNNRIHEAIRENKDIDGRTDNIVKFRAVFTTWSDDEDTLRVNAQTLQNAVRAWGHAMIDGISGDPLATTVSTIPGVTLASTAPVGAGPLTDILCLSPIGRQASPWDTGPVLFRTQSGKPWYFQPGSSKQETWIYLVCGTPGSGKSVLLNAINLGTILGANSSGAGTVLPRISIIDIGSSSSGLISLIKEALPNDKKHLAVFKRLTMTERDAINVFDTSLGARLPISGERDFLINFMSIVCSDGKQEVGGAMRGLISAAIDQAYQKYSDEVQPKRYHPNEEPLVDQALKEIGYRPEKNETWWNLVDELSANRKLHAAEVAQRHAVPVLSDLATVVSQMDSSIVMYEGIQDSDTKQSLIDSFTRMISEIVRDFPILSSHTKFDLGSARIISLDLQEVTSKGDTLSALKQTALMYMVGRQVSTRDFYQKEDDYEVLYSKGGLPKQYFEYHKARCRQNLQIQKVVCFDEFHRAKDSPAIINQVERDGREGRKHNILVNILSQFPDDFSEKLIGMASGMFVCNARGDGLDYLSRTLKLTEADHEVMRHRLTGPGKDGAPFWGMFIIKNRGQIRQDLVLTLGPVELWAFSTTAKDVAIRNALYSRLGPKLARQVLAKRFPGGTAVPEIDARIERIENEAEKLGDAAQENITEQIIEEMVKQAQILQMNM